MSSGFHLSRRSALRVLSAAAVVGPISRAMADAWPTKPVRIVVPAVAGSSADILARLVGEHTARASGQPWVVDNRPGAGGIIGSDLVAKASPDGYTVLFTANNFVISPSMYPTVPYSPLNDFVPVSLVSAAPTVIFINASTGVKSIADLVALARRTPEGLNYGSPFVGTSAHLLMEMFKRAAAINLVHVPAKGTPQAFNEALAGRVPLVVGNFADGAAFVKAGSLRAIAVADTRRSPLLPDVPTLSEAGYTNLDLQLWFGVLAPARTPPAVIERMNRLITASLEASEVRRGLEDRGFEARPSTPDGFGALMRKELPMYAQIIREADLKI
jgi:tripartite-type tricarboxylate transporter receptor subunit TctC